MSRSSDPGTPASAGATSSSDGSQCDPSSRVLDEFAARLVQHVRDRSVADVLAALRPEGGRRAPIGPNRASDKGASTQELVGAIVPDVVDLVVVNLLDAIDHRLLSLELTDEASGARIQLGGSGELAGAYLADQGWRRRFGAASFDEWDGTDDGPSGRVDRRAMTPTRCQRVGSK